MPRTLLITLFIALITLGNVQASNIAPLIQLAQSYAAAGNHHASFDTYWLAFRQEPGNIDINYNLGLEAARIADFESAVMAFERVLLLDPDATQAKIELAKSFFKLGAKKTAQRYFTEVLSAENLPPETKDNIMTFLKKLN